MFLGNWGATRDEIEGPVVGDDIFHWSPRSWAVWCFPCYKAEHFHNLTRLQERHNGL